MCKHAGNLNAVVKMARHVYDQKDGLLKHKGIDTFTLKPQIYSELATTQMYY